MIGVPRLHTDNKRLDEWVGEERLDLRRIQFPRKDKDAPTTTTQCTTTGLNTPKKVPPRAAADTEGGDILATVIAIMGIHGTAHKASC